MARLRATTLYSAAAYGTAALAFQLFFIVVDRRSVLLARPVWSVLALTVGISTAVASWLWTAKRK
jgi:hypothetical protein